MAKGRIAKEGNGKVKGKACDGVIPHATFSLDEVGIGIASGEGVKR